MVPEIRRLVQPPLRLAARARKQTGTDLTTLQRWRPRSKTLRASRSATAWRRPARRRISESERRSGDIRTPRVAGLERCAYAGAGNALRRSPAGRFAGGFSFELT